MADVVHVVRKLRDTFSSGRTRSYEWRIAQLKQVLKLVDENEDQFIEALREDIGKPPFESFIAEVFTPGPVLSACLVLYWCLLLKSKQSKWA